jgi:hypothetical protein
MMKNLVNCDNRDVNNYVGVKCPNLRIHLYGLH